MLKWGLFARIFNIWNSSHALSYTVAFGLMLYVAYREKNIWNGWIFGGSVIAIHELMWYIVYPFYYIYGFNNFLFYLPFQLMLISFLYLGMKHYHLSFIFYVAIFIYGFWIIQNFPVTLTFIGKTIYYNSLDVNLIEILSWITIVLAGAYTYEFEN